MPRRMRLTADDADLEPAGTVICEGVIPGRAVAWKAPTIGRNGGCVPNRSYKAYKAWQDVVRLHAEQAMGRRKRTYQGPVSLCFWFYLAPKGSVPDTSNLVKSTEDSLQGVVVVNDRQVKRIAAERILTAQEPERVEFRVVACE